MILVDANLLLYAKIADYPQHAAAREWLDERFNAPERVGLPWPSLLAFLRIITNPRIFPRPMGIDEAWAQVAQWLALPRVWVPQPTDRHAEVFGNLLTVSGAAAALVPDTHLAALALQHGLMLASTDGDFARFPGLRWSNPLS